MFNDKFNKYACSGDYIETEINGITYRATIHYDTEYDIDDDDCHNTDQNITGCNDKQFARLLKTRQAWFDNDWFFCGIVISAHKHGVVLDDHAASLWGLECNYPGARPVNNDFLSETANELLPEAIESATSILTRLAS